jgi:hypothetical protein
MLRVAPTVEPFTCACGGPSGRRARRCPAAPGRDREPDLAGIGVARAANGIPLAGVVRNEEIHVCPLGSNPRRALRRVDLNKNGLLGSGRTADFPVVTDAASLAWIVNLRCIDLHTWHCRVDDVERPDYMLIDLDPSEGNPWEHVRTIALVLKEVMDELDLPSFPKTSGATGLHILVPIRPELLFTEVRRFAKALAQEVERRIDDQNVATTTWEGGGPARRLRRLWPELARPHDRVRLFDSPDEGRAGFGAASLGGGRSRRARGVHAHDDAGAREEGGGSHHRDVAEDEPRPALREARSRTTHSVGAGMPRPGRS